MLRNAIKWSVYATIACCCFFADLPPTFAQDRERAELEERIDILAREAAEFREHGNQEQAARRLEEVRELRGHLANLRRADEGPRARYLQQIFAAVDALRELGRPEEARRLFEIGQSLRRGGEGRVEDEREEHVVIRRFVRRAGEEQREREERDERERDGRRDTDRDREERREREERRQRGPREREREEREEGDRNREDRPERERDRERRVDREGDREREEHPEVRAARQQMEVLRMAMSVLAEADRGDAANRLEQAIHALELAMEGERSDEARRVRQSAPNRAEQAELLMAAHRMLRERGREEQARAVGQLAERFAAAARRGRQNERNQQLREVQARIRELSAQLEELHRHVENLQRD